jgi:hypothetical protein
MMLALPVMFVACARRTPVTIGAPEDMDGARVAIDGRPAGVLHGPFIIPLSAGHHSA